ncbi:unnamed protein product [Brassica rapa]|uniref:Uncharacterized protein n=2 Tax=Brassica TaxID=3705 RepID=A0A8D9GSC0_BRACM|nr:unnamed protein product [Brassica napus]CAG7885594.1 unnamed protein product [Brassica rapa]
MESLRVYVVPRRCAGAGGECGGGTRAVDELIETMMVYFCIYIYVFIFFFFFSVKEISLNLTGPNTIIQLQKP